MHNESGQIQLGRCHMTLLAIFLTAFFVSIVSYQVALRNKEVKAAAINMALDCNSFFKFAFSNFNGGLLKAMWNHSKINTVIYHASCIIIYPVIILFAIATWPFVKGEFQKLKTL